MLDRKIAPDFNKEFSFSLIEPEILSLKNGACIYFVPGGQQNIVKVEIIFDAGRWVEPATGISYFTSNLLSKGTDSKNSFTIASEFDQLGAHLEINPGLDNLSISLYALTSKFKETLGLLMAILSKSIFPEKELQQLKSIYIQNLKVNKEKTSFLSSRFFRKTLFGESHPYGSDMEETHVAQIHRDSLISFRDQFFKNFQIFVSGKIENDSRKAIISAFENAPFSVRNEQSHPLIPSKDFDLYVEKKDNTQTSLRVGKRTIGRSHADYPKFLLLNHILGGYFGSRLMKNIREEKGLTYGIHASIHALQHDTYFIIGTDVNKENKDIAFEEIRKELGLLRTELVSDEELDTARFHFLGSLQSDLATTFAHADKIKNIVINNLEINFYPVLIDNIKSATSKELIDIANKYLTEDRLAEIAVG